MRVYTTQEIKGEVVLNSYKSIKLFLSEHGWCDREFIHVTTTKCLETFEFANERSIIVYSDLEKKSQMMLRDIYLCMNKKREAEKPI